MASEIELLKAAIAKLNHQVSLLEKNNNETIERMSYELGTNLKDVYYCFINEIIIKSKNIGKRIFNCVKFNLLIPETEYILKNENIITFWNQCNAININGIKHYKDIDENNTFYLNLVKSYYKYLLFPRLEYIFEITLYHHLCSEYITDKLNEYKIDKNTSQTDTNFTALISDLSEYFRSKTLTTEDIYSMIDQFETGSSNLYQRSFYNFGNDYFTNHKFKIKTDYKYILLYFRNLSKVIYEQSFNLWLKKYATTELEITNNSTNKHNIIRKEINDYMLELINNIIIDMCNNKEIKSTLITNIINTYSWIFDTDNLNTYYDGFKWYYDEELTKQSTNN